MCMREEEALAPFIPECAGSGVPRGAGRALKPLWVRGHTQRTFHETQGRPLIPAEAIPRVRPPPRTVQAGTSAGGQGVSAERQGRGGRAAWAGITSMKGPDRPSAKNPKWSSVGAWGPPQRPALGPIPTHPAPPRVPCERANCNACPASGDYMGCCCDPPAFPFVVPGSRDGGAMRSVVPHLRHCGSIQQTLHKPPGSGLGRILTVWCLSSRNVWLHKEMRHFTQNDQNSNCDFSFQPQPTLWVAPKWVPPCACRTPASHSPQLSPPSQKSFWTARE